MADNFNISDVPESAGPKSVEVPGDIADGTAGELMTWDAAGVAALVATGAATEVLTSNGAGTAPTFQAGGGGGGVTSFNTRVGAVVALASDYDASQVDNDSGVAGAFVDDALNTLGGAITGLDSTDIANVSGVAGATVTAALNTLDGASASVSQLDRFTANDAVFVGASAATGTARNGHSLIAFDDTVNEEIIFEGVMSNDYDGAAAFIIEPQWAGASAIVGDVKWDAQIERLNEGGADLDVDSFAAVQTVTEATEGTSGELTYTGITFTNAQADGIQPGESYRLRIIRDAVAGGDDMVGDAQLLSVDLRLP